MSSISFMNIKKLWFILFLVLFGCSKQEQGISLEHQVYEHIFNEIFQDARQSVLISDRYTLGMAKGMSVNELINYSNLKDLPSNSLSKLLTSGEQGKPTWQPIMITARYIDASQDDIQLRNNFWKRFSKEHKAGGYYTLSRVVLDEKNEEAVVMFGYRCLGLCGSRDVLIHLKKTGMEWKVVTAQKLWIS